jgi:predicted nucleic acid-binding protein
VVPDIGVRECRDPSDDKYLEAAFAAAALHDSDALATIVSDDQDLLALDPWRAGIRILKPEAVLAALTNPLQFGAL